VSQSPGWSTYSHYPSVPPPRLIHPSCHCQALPAGPNQSFFFRGQSVLLLLPGFDATPPVHSFWAFSLPSAPCHVGPQTIGHWTLLARLAAWCFQAFSLQLPLLIGRLLTRPFVNTSA